MANTSENFPVRFVATCTEETIEEIDYIMKHHRTLSRAQAFRIAIHDHADYLKRMKTIKKEEESEENNNAEEVTIG